MPTLELPAMFDDPFNYLFVVALVLAFIGGLRIFDVVKHVLQMGYVPPPTPVNRRPPEPQGSGGPSNSASMANVRAALDVLNNRPATAPAPATPLSPEDRTRVIDLDGAD